VSVNPRLDVQHVLLEPDLDVLAVDARHLHDEPERIVGFEDVVLGT
jgi:hypothetical protein